MLGHPAHLIALGLGAGLSPWMPGTIGTLLAWLVFLIAYRWIGPSSWGVVLLVGTAIGVWACTRTARDLVQADPGCVVWDEVIAFWLVLWLVMPAGLWVQVAAFVLFRIFDVAKPGPVAWADAVFKAGAGQPVTWKQGWGIIFDDLVAALCTLIVMALWKVL
jgi:phosphatidylglycerophosphatase A